MGTGKDASQGWWRALIEPGPYLQTGQAPSGYFLTRFVRLSVVVFVLISKISAHKKEKRERTCWSKSEKQSKRNDCSTTRL